MGRPGPADVALGFRVRTGRAIAVLLVGPVKTPKVVARRELVLHDEHVPDSLQPYHAALELAPSEAEATLRRLCEIVREASAAAVQGILDEFHRSGLEPRSAGLVVGSLVDPGTIKNPHMHAHAAEGRLFFESLATGLARCGLESLAHAENDIHRHAAKALGATEGALDRDVVTMGKAFAKPWRKDERMAALAAWVALRGR